MAFGEKREYLVLRLAYGDLTLMVPADNTDGVGLREVINDEEVEEVFAVLRKKEARMPTNWSRRYKNHSEKLRSGDIYQVAEVVRNLSIRDKDKGLSAGEKRMLRRARQILVSELTFALGGRRGDGRAAPERRTALIDRAMPGVWAIVVAGGSGERFGAPKQFALLAGRPVVEWSVAACRPGCRRGGPRRPGRQPRSGRHAPYGADVVVAGGATPVGVGACGPGRRAVRRRRGASSTTPPARWPPPALFAAVVAALDEPAWPARHLRPAGERHDRSGSTRRRRATGRGRHLDRRDLVAVQTPQAFAAAVLRRAHAAGADATDDAALVEALGA